MSVRERVFEAWANAGDDRTFDEWRAYRRRCHEEARRRTVAVRAHFTEMQQGQFALSGLHQALMANTQQQNPYRRLGHRRGLFGTVGGVFG